MWWLFDIHATALSWLGYDMSWVELLGTVFNLASVWLLARNKVLGWPVGLIGVVLFGFLFYQIQLYSDLLQQIYYFVTNLYGWWLWRSASNQAELPISRGSFRENVCWFVSFVSGSLALGALMTQIHVLLPTYFKEPASYPYMDATLTVASFIGNYLMARRRIEAWVIWVFVNIFAIYLYYVKSVFLIALLFVVFLVFAFKGLIIWLRIMTGRKLLFP